MPNFDILLSLGGKNSLDEAEQAFKIQPKCGDITTSDTKSMFPVFDLYGLCHQCYWHICVTDDQITALGLRNILHPKVLVVFVTEKPLLYPFKGKEGILSIVNGDPVPLNTNFELEWHGIAQYILNLPYSEQDGFGNITL